MKSGSGNRTEVFAHGRGPQQGERLILPTPEMGGRRICFGMLGRRSEWHESHSVPHVDFAFVGLLMAFSVN